MREFAFELAVCSKLEAERSAIVSRQLGGGVHRPGGRILDVITVEPGPAFARRAAITAETIPAAAIEAEVGPGQFRAATRVIDGPPERARQIAEQAAEIGFFETERRGGQLYVRQVTRYPSAWFGKLVGIENKPDLDRPGALETQLRTDVSLGLLDNVVLATASHVTGAHLNRIPDPVGVWQVAPDTEPALIEVVREPAQLPTESGGVELLGRHPGQAEIEIVSSNEKSRARRRIGERAYGKGWRTYDLPDCAQLVPTEAGCPDCNWAGEVINPSVVCGPDCPGYSSTDAPTIDLEALRDRRSPWSRDPQGFASQQAGLDRFR